MVGRLSTLALTMVLLACASSGTRAGTGRDRNFISAEEIAAVSATTALDLIQQLRPAWLRARGPTSIAGGGPDVPVVYVDEIRSSDPNALERMSSQVVLEIRFLAGRDATTMYGLDHSGGAIMIKTRR